MTQKQNNTECHPLKPFLPRNARLLMLGSFPPKHERWSMEFFYPNFQNDMWRIMGLLFFDDKQYFTEQKERVFNRDKIVSLCTTTGIALFDTAIEIIRVKDNASDKFLEIIEATDIPCLLEQLPDISAIAATGQKAAEVISDLAKCDVPKVGESIAVEIEGRKLNFYRMPSSSRAYPMSVEKKSEFYGKMLRETGIL